MSQENFSQKADELINFVYNRINQEQKYSHLEVDILDDILHIFIENGDEFVINKHNILKEIWLASPVSGASHFIYRDDQNQWVSTRNEEFFEKLFDDLNYYCSIAK